MSQTSAGKLVNPFSLYSFGIGKAYKRIFKNKKEQKHLAFGLLTSW